MQTKICSKCKIKKPLSEFNKYQRSKDGLKHSCKECRKKEAILYRKNNRDKCLAYSREYYKLHKDKRDEYFKKNKEKLNANKKRYIERHPDRRLEQSKRYYHTHKEEIKRRYKENSEKNNERRRLYMNNNPQARIAHNLRSRIGNVLNNKSKGGRLCLLIGCDVIYFKKYLESLWEDGMNWENYGRGVDKWSLDHIIPLCNFNLEDEDECKRAFHYSNCQPMWYSENSSKSNRYIGAYQK